MSQEPTLRENIHPTISQILCLLNPNVEGKQKASQTLLFPFYNLAPTRTASLIFLFLSASASDDFEAVFLDAVDLLYVEILGIIGDWR